MHALAAKRDIYYLNEANLEYIHAMICTRANSKSIVQNREDQLRLSRRSSTLDGLRATLMVSRASMATKTLGGSPC